MRGISGKPFAITSVAAFVFLFIEASLLLGRRGHTDFNTAALAAVFLTAPVILALAVGLADQRAVRRLSLLLAGGGFVAAVWLLWRAFTSTSSTAGIALVFWPLVELLAFGPTLALGVGLDALMGKFLRGAGDR